MIRICNMCGADIKPGATKCSCCGHLVEDVAVSNSEVYVNLMPRPAAPNSAAHYGSPQYGAPQYGAPQHYAPAAPAAPASQKYDGNYNIFASPTWQGVWAEKRANADKLGIVLTNTQGAMDTTAFTQALNSYIAHKAARGVQYYVLDIKDQLVRGLPALDIEEMTELLRDVYSVAVPEYVMIVGDSTVIPCAEWINVCNDSDETVPSDLAYITLYTGSPWDGVVFDFENIPQIGRIPAKAENGFATAIRYFNNMMLFEGYNATKSFAYSALVWEQTSRVEFAHLRPDLVTSPVYTSANLGRVGGEYNMVCFNLHGSDEGHAWYGQEGWDFPEAFNKELLPVNGGYALLTEACYGARPTYSESIVVNALENNCIAFVGSSKIAFGCGDGSLCCADIIAQSFTKGFVNGMTAGKAFLSALSALNSPHYMCEEDIKTLAEFALYADPSVTLIAGAAKKAFRREAATKCSTVKKDVSRGIKLMSFDEENGAMSAKGGLTLYSCSPEEQAHISDERASVTHRHRAALCAGAGRTGRSGRGWLDAPQTPSMGTQRPLHAAAVQALTGPEATRLC